MSNRERECVALVVGVWLAILPQFSIAAEIVLWEVTTANLTSAPESVVLRGQSKEAIAIIKKSQVIKLLAAKERIRYAAALGDTALAISSQDQPNAFAGTSSNGRRGIVITLPLLKLLGEDEDLMASVIGHEFGHLVAGHTGRGERVAAATVLGALAGVIAGQLLPGGGIAVNLTASAIDLGGRAAIYSFDRDQEREADAHGVALLAKAGYDPYAAVRYWELLSEHTKEGGIFTTHPRSSERSENLRQLAIAYPRGQGNPTLDPNTSSGSNDISTFRAITTNADATPTLSGNLMGLQLALKLAIKQVRGNGKRIIVTFEDPNCAYCKILAKELQGMTDITIYTFLYPILSKDSVSKATAIWCSRDQGHAWTEWMLRGAPPTNEQCNAPIAEILSLGRKHGVRGTPTIFLANGNSIPGVLPAAALDRAVTDASLNRRDSK